MKKLRALLIVLAVIVILPFLVFTGVDRTPLEDTDHYQATMNRIATMKLETENDTVRVGWSRVNITQSVGVPLAGYGARKEVSTGVMDSVYLRVLWLENQYHTAVMISADLLIFPPELRNYLTKYVARWGLNKNNLYLSATHSHSSFGGWSPGVVGQLIIGEYDQNVVDTLSVLTRKALDEAKSNLANTRFSYNKIRIDDLINNRIVQDEGIINPWLKYVKLTRDDGKTAVVTAYSGHPTCFGPDHLEISGDYPGQLLAQLEQDDSLDFSMFLGGPMGSMGRPQITADPARNIVLAGQLLAEKILNDSADSDYLTHLNTQQVSIDMGPPQLRISENIRIRPWIFHQLVGRPESYISTMKLNDLMMITTPCDFSGEIAFEIDSILSTRDQSIMINSFNGSYIGYITDDKWYDRKTYETRDMNWYGPYNGRYFTDIIYEINDLYAK